MIFNLETPLAKQWVLIAEWEWACNVSYDPLTVVHIAGRKILYFCSQNDCQRQKAYSCTLYIFVQFYLSALPWLANIYLSEMDCNLLVPLCVSERPMQTEKQAQSHHWSAIHLYLVIKTEGCFSRWWEAGACVCFVSTCSSLLRVCWCATRTLQSCTYKPCWDLQSEVPLLQAIKQAIIIYVAVAEKTSYRKYDFLAFLTWLENVKGRLYFSLPFWKMCCLHMLLLCA